VQESARRELVFKQTHKLSPDAVELIVKMSAEGYSDKGISAELEARFGIHVHRNSLGYYRWKHAPEVAQASTAALNAAREESSLATLAGRLMRVEKLYLVVL
jgi:transposase-like protein